MQQVLRSININESDFTLNILYLCHRIPFPPTKGDKIRSYNQIKYLSKNHKIYLGTLIDHQSNVKFMEILSNYCEDVFACKSYGKIKLFHSLINNKPFSISFFYASELQKYVDEVFSKHSIDAVICYCSSMAEYIFNTPRYKADKLKGVKLIIDYVDLDSDKWNQYSLYARFPFTMIYKLEQLRLFNYEKRINTEFDHSLFVADREVEIFRKLYNRLKNTVVIPNGVDTDYFFPEKNGLQLSYDKPKGPILVFTGVMNYFANVDGVIWFVEKIFPLIKKEYPDLKFYIVGNKPTVRVKNLQKTKNVIVTGYVDDIRQYYWMADICVIPLRIARGLQNKVLEAMACGKPVVTTKNASNGIMCENNKNIVIADDENAFAKAVIQLLSNSESRKALGTMANENIRENYLWDVQLSKLDCLLSDNEKN